MRIFFALMLIAGLWACNGAEKTPAENTTTVPQDTTTTVEEAQPTEPQDTTPPAPYENIEWKLSTLAGQKLFKDASITAMLKKGAISGSGGCNQYSGTYTVDEGGVLSVSELASSKRMCDGLMGQESKFFEILRGATSLKMNKVELVITSPAGELVFHNTPGAPAKSKAPAPGETPEPKKK
jgi:heat shock protein HslJ